MGAIKIVDNLFMWFFFQNDADASGIKEENGNQKTLKITENFNQNVVSKPLFPRESQLL